MKRTIITLLTAVTLVSCSKSKMNSDEQQIINTYSQCIIDMSKASSIIMNKNIDGDINLYADSVAQYLKHARLTYPEALIKIYEMQNAVADQLSYYWVEAATKRYMSDDSTIVVIGDDNEDKDSATFRESINTNLKTGLDALHTCLSDPSPYNISTLAFNSLETFNTFYFCYYFITDDINYLNFFSQNSSLIDFIHHCSDTLYTLNISDEQAFRLSTLLEATAFTVTVNTLSFNTIWSKHKDEMQQLADFFDNYSSPIMQALDPTSNMRMPEFDYDEYLGYMKEITAKKAELIDLMLRTLRESTK